MRSWEYYCGDTSSVQSCTQHTQPKTQPRHYSDTRQQKVPHRKHVYTVVTSVPRQCARLEHRTRVHDRSGSKSCSPDPASIIVYGDMLHKLHAMRLRQRSARNGTLQFCTLLHLFNTCSAECTRLYYTPTAPTYCTRRLMS